jgi:poly(3-hydroxybutyrate) depolymerase
MTLNIVNQLKKTLFCFLQKGLKTKVVYSLPGILFLTLNLNAQEIQTLKVGNTNREMIVYATTGIPNDRPLVISMHGMNQTMTDQKNQTQFITVARNNNFVLVFPQAIGNQWQLGGTGDTDFILVMIDDMHKKFGIDRNRVYLSGFSMGGMMTYYAATKIADKIAAYAPVSGFLMGGPDTNSSRPIPIIHIHGADDTYVPYNRVQECMDAWIKRNGCPTTAKITNPYPTDKSNSKSIRFYWGLGKEGVELVVIGVASVGHWYSDNSNDVFTSQEIWNFCSKYSLKIGVPEFVSATVSNNNPKQIKLTLSTSIADSVTFNGFTLKINNVPVIINNIVLSDSNKLTINVQENILNSDEILLSYNNGNVWSTLNKQLTNFTDIPVDNLLFGSAPRITAITTNANADT